MLEKTAPFASEAQRRLLWSKHPEIAKRWSHEFPGQHDLPMHVKDKKKKKKKKRKKMAKLAACFAPLFK
jgi:hypothetical protein